MAGTLTSKVGLKSAGRTAISSRPQELADIITCPLNPSSEDKGDVTVDYEDISDVVFENDLMNKSMVSQQILTAVMTCIVVVNKNTVHAKPHSICFLPQH